LNSLRPDLRPRQLGHRPKLCCLSLDLCFFALVAIYVIAEQKVAEDRDIARSGLMDTVASIRAARCHAS